jgi:aminopeptidase N
MTKLLNALFFLFFITNCATSLKFPKSPARVAQRYLEQGYAEYRSSLISGVKYNLAFDLTNENSFSGTSHITFLLTQPKELTIDFYNGTVTGVKVNSTEIPVAYNSFFITIPQQHLVAGNNSIEIQFNHLYSTSGSGLYRFVDPVDKKVYLYSDFEPYDAHLMFPCFDQPDLKATYQSKVTAPKNWVVVSSTLESAVKKSSASAEWTFPESGIFSTYIFSLHAGEYKIWKNNAKTKTQTIPLRLMVRQSLAKYVDPEEWFLTTRNGFAFFEEYFGHPYAYKKYDQLIVPDFNSGAMENVGAVTFNERTVSRTQKERAEKRMLANIILHEMAHMWFGNLVTMKWWNDIWLNESFATFAAFKGLVSATQFKEAWTEFYASAKRGAYFADQSITTHPIEFTVANTDVVFANFDGITYGKGASVLKQLDFYIGSDKFKTGLKNYFNKHAYKNTTLPDFMNEMSTASNIDLTEWQKMWLTIPQVNTAQVVYQCQTGKIVDFQIKQTAVPQHPTLRAHKTRISVLNPTTSGFTTSRTVDVIYKGETTAVSALNGTKCAEDTLVFANQDDFDYVKLNLDAASIKAVEASLGKIPDELTRISLWGTLWEMVRDQQMVATKYFDIAIKHLAKESDIEVLTAVTGRVTAVLERYLPTDEKGKAAYAKLHPQWVAFLLERTKSSKTVDEQKRWFDFYLDNLNSAAELTIAQKMLDQKPTWLKFSIDQDRRWQILQHLSSYGVQGIQKRLEQEKKNDPSQRGENNYEAALAAQPMPEVKEQRWTSIIQGPRPEMSLGKLKPIIWNLFPAHQEDLHQKFQDRFYSQLQAFKKQPPEFLSTFVSLAPAFCSQQTQAKLQNFAQQNKNLPETVLKNLKISAQEDDRCIKIRSKVSATL